MLGDWVERLAHHGSLGYRCRSMSRQCDNGIDRCQYVRVKPIATLSTSCPPLLAGPLEADEADDLAQALKVIADPARLRLLSLIQAQPSGEACVCHLTEPLGLDPADGQPPPEGAAERRPRRARTARKLGLLPRRPRPAPLAARAAHLARRVERVPETLDRLRDESVVSPRRPALGLDEPRVAKDSQMVRDSRLRELEHSRQIAPADPPPRHSSNKRNPPRPPAPGAIERRCPKRHSTCTSDFRRRGACPCVSRATRSQP